MSEKQKCVVCEKEVIWEDVIEEMGHIFDQVDMYGEHSLAEHQQMVYHGRVCSYNCYEHLS